MLYRQKRQHTKSHSRYESMCIDQYLAFLLHFQINTKNLLSPHLFLFLLPQKRQCNQFSVPRWKSWRNTLKLTRVNWLIFSVFNPQKGWCTQISYSVTDFQNISENWIAHTPLIKKQIVMISLVSWKFGVILSLVRGIYFSLAFNSWLKFS